jgi:TRAP-type mannitol/chloroaromatic compound transport system permease small subunit
MPKALVAYVRYIESMNNWLGKAVGGLVFALIGILLFETISRYVFNDPTVWSLELGAFIWGFYFLIGGGWVLLREGHVRMDALSHRWPPRRRAIFDLATFALMAVYLVTFIIGGIDGVLYSLGVGEVSFSKWNPPLAPIKIIVVIGAVLLLLQGIAFLIRDFSILRGKKDLEPRT